MGHSASSAADYRTSTEHTLEVRAFRKKTTRREFLAASHESIGLESDPLGYCYDLTNQIIGPSGIPIDW